MTTATRKGYRDISLQWSDAGTLEFNATTANNSIQIGNIIATDVVFNGATAGRDVQFDASANTLRALDNAILAVGTGSDLTLSHNATDSAINNITGALTIDSVGALAIESSTGAISVGADAVAQPCNIGTGAAARVITIGNAASASLTLEAGVGALQVNADTTMALDAGTALTIESDGGAISVGADAVAQPCNFATGAAARVVTIGNALTTSIAMTSLATTLGTTGAVSQLVSIPHVMLGEATNGAVVSQGYTIDVAGGAQTISAAELCNGYYYKGAAGGGVALTLPAAADVQTYLAARGITTAAGMRLPDILVDVSDANTLTLTAAAGSSVFGSPAITNIGAVVKVIMTGAATLDAIGILSS